MPKGTIKLISDRGFGFILPSGGVSEWPMVTVLKTVVVARRPWVRIPPPPFNLSERSESNGQPWGKNGFSTLSGAVITLYMPVLLMI